MLNFVKRAFRGFFEVFLWLNLILCGIAGGVIGNSMRSYDGRGKDSGGHPILGVLLGLVAGFLLDIIVGGLIATLLNIDENLEFLRHKSSKIGNTPSGNSSGTNVNYIPPVPQVNNGDSWVCKKCNERNPNTALTCKGCGEYK